MTKLKFVSAEVNVLLQPCLCVAKSVPRINYLSTTHHSQADLFILTFGEYSAT